MTAIAERPFHDVDDPWGFVRGALNDELRYRSAHLDADRYEEAVSYLVEILCRLAKRYDSSKGSLSFSTFAYRILRRRYTSYLRDWRGDARYGNDGRETSVADPDLLREAASSEDQLDFGALIEQIDHDKLSPRARGALKQIVRLIVEEGMTAAEAARALAKSRREASRDLDRLRQELLTA